MEEADADASDAGAAVLPTTLTPGPSSTSSLVMTLAGLVVPVAFFSSRALRAASPSVSDLLTVADWPGVISPSAAAAPSALLELV